MPLPILPDIVVQYTSFKQMTDDISDARVYGGIQLPHEPGADAQLGHAIGIAVYKKKFNRVHNGD